MFLAHLLAIAVALGSFTLYFSAFFFPEVHRKSDFYWSGLGFFYGLVLWVCAGRITGAVLLGQTASTALLLWFGTQTLILRRVLTPPAEKTKVSEAIATRLQSLSPLKLWQNIRQRNTQATVTQQSPSSQQESENAEATAIEPSSSQKESD